jgi:hypothetical protein
MSNGGGLASINHVVVLMLENRSFDHMLGFLYTAQGTCRRAASPSQALPEPSRTNQLFGRESTPAGPLQAPGCQSFVKDFSYRSQQLPGQRRPCPRTCSGSRLI